MSQRVEIDSKLSASEPLVRAGVALCGLSAVAALLAWAYRLGSFQRWFWMATVPALLIIAVVARATARTGARDLHNSIVAGAFGGLLGTAAYDLFRAPFALLGYRLLSPIDSYGVLLLGARHSSPATAMAGWLYHLADGIGFGIAYGVLFSRRDWRWGLAWGSMLETMSLLTPLGGLYGISGKPDVILLAYGGHLAYGATLGLLVQHRDETVRYFGVIGRHAFAAALVVTVAGLSLWLRPWSRGSSTTAVQNGHLTPAWLRVAPGGCAHIANRDTVAYDVPHSNPPAQLVPGQTTTVCFTGSGAKRIKFGAGPWSGGFVLVDPVLAS